jgi:hypothetical protein
LLAAADAHYPHAAPPNVTGIWRIYASFTERLIGLSALLEHKVDIRVLHRSMRQMNSTAPP